MQWRKLVAENALDGVLAEYGAAAARRSLRRRRLRQGLARARSSSASSPKSRRSQPPVDEGACIQPAVRKIFPFTGTSPAIKVQGLRRSDDLPGQVLQPAAGRADHRLHHARQRAWPCTARTVRTSRNLMFNADREIARRVGRPAAGAVPGRAGDRHGGPAGDPGASRLDGLEHEDEHPPDGEPRQRREGHRELVAGDRRPQTPRARDPLDRRHRRSRSTSNGSSTCATPPHENARTHGRERGLPRHHRRRYTLRARRDSARRRTFRHPRCFLRSSSSARRSSSASR